MEKKLSSLSDEKLSELYRASIMANAVYLEDTLQFNCLMMKSKLTNKNNLFDAWFNYQKESRFIDLPDMKSEKYFEEIGALFNDFSKLFMAKNVDLVDSLRKETADLYKIFFKKEYYSNRDKFNQMVDNDLMVSVQKELLSFFKFQLNVDGLTNAEHEKEFKSTLKDKFNVDLSFLYKDGRELESVVLNKVKTNIAMKDELSHLRRIKPSFMGLDNSGLIKNSSGFWMEYEITGNVVEIGEVGKEKDASFLVSFYRNEGGSPELHISFRGTEDKAKSMSKYIAYDYQNMERHYNNIEPVLEKIIGSINERFMKSHNTLQVKLSGHSLGGAMVEKFLEKHKDDEKNIKYSAFTFGSPGARHKFQRIANAVDFIADFLSRKLYVPTLAGGVRFAASFAISMTTAVGGLVVNHVMKSEAFFALGGDSLVSFLNNREKDDRLTTVKHVGDIVPKVGRLLYKADEDSVLLSNMNAEESVKNHKMYNYTNEIAEEILRRKTMSVEYASLFALDKAIKDTPYVVKTNKHKMLDFSMKVIENKMKKIRELSQIRDGLASSVENKVFKT